MVLFLTHSNTKLSPSTRVCGLSLLGRIILASYYAGIRHVVASKSLSIHKKDVEGLLSNRGLDIKIDYSDVKPTQSLELDVSCVVDTKMLRSMLEGKRDGLCYKLNSCKDIKEAGAKLLESCRKVNDGPITVAYRYVSLALSRYFVRMPITPNQISVLTVIISMLGALMIISSQGPALLVAGLLMQILAAIVDCSDGEVARLKYQFSSKGEWVDTICDNFTTFFFLLAVAVKSSNLLLGSASLIVYMLAALTSSAVLFFKEKSGTLLAINDKFRSKNLLSKLVAELVRRDLSTIYLCVLAGFGFFELVLLMSLLGSAGVFIYSMKQLLRPSKKEAVIYE